MKTFEGVAFRGAFRDYQQHILSDLDRYSEDKKIHIVAAPGSGKTILGLEIIRQLNEPALILSPSIVIRQQWSQRFEENFLPPGSDADDYVSCSLRDMKLLNSVTYQSLHSAYTRQTEERDEDEENGGEDGHAVADYTDFDLIGAVRAAGIKTICLDEAHHLKAEWQRALEGFIQAVQGEMFVVALTATPPYDSEPDEWKRYLTVCGEIDEEIAVPELVQQRTLCPHQDYIYFNYPTREEIAKVKSFREEAERCAQELLHGEDFGAALKGSCMLTDYLSMEELLTEHAKGFVAILVLAGERGEKVPKRLARLLVPDGKLPPYRLAFAETAFQFIIDHPDIFTPEAAQDIRKALSKAGFYDKKVCLQYSDSIQRMLVSSNGKLESVKSIVAAESAAMGGALRMLILTDYIRRDMMSIVGTEQPIGAIGTVTAFEAVRRAAAPGVRVALLSGTLVILPNEALDAARELSKQHGVPMTVKPIAGTSHSEAVFGGANKHKVAVLTDAFEAGYIHVLVGTKALLGEGWDSPCINSLILASFVGSFVLTNQMRGRAIRTDKNDPGKTANIWHLVTIEPDYGLKAVLGGLYPKDSFASCDFDTLIRRFDCFLAPAYERDVITSGIERVSIIRPSFDSAGFGRINAHMLQLAARRDDLTAKWNAALGGPSHPEVIEVAEMPPQVVPRAFIFTNLLYEAVLGSILALVIRFIAEAMSVTDSLLLAAAGLVVIGMMTAGFVKLMRFISPERTIRTLSACILETLKEIKAVRSFDAMTDIEADAEGRFIQCGIRGATLHEKKVFADAMRELLTSIDNPRYLLIKEVRVLTFTFRRYGQSYACPSVIGVKQEYVEKLIRHLKRTSGAFDYIFTRNEAGRRALIKCRRRSYINRNEMFITGKKVARKRWE